MQHELPYAEINAAKVPADENVGGLLFTVSTLITFFLAIPFLHYMFPAAIAAGCGVAWVLHFRHRESPRAIFDLQ